MRNRTSLLYGRRHEALALAIAAVAAACGGNNGAPLEFAVQTAPPMKQQAWSNGNFETDTIGTTPPTGWTVTNASNGEVNGSPATPPASQTDLNLTGAGT